MTTIAVMLKHSGRWSSHYIYENYKVDAIALTEQTNYNTLYDLIVTQIGIDLRYNYIRIEYKVDDDCNTILIHNDMGVKVYLMQKNVKIDFNLMPLCVSVFDIEQHSNLSNEVLICGEDLETVVNTTSGTELVGVDCSDVLDVLPLRMPIGMITDNKQKHIEAGQIYKDKKTLKAVMKEYSIREGCNLYVDRSSKTRYHLICVNDKCEFTLKASCINKTEWFVIRVFNPKHTCPIRHKRYNPDQASSSLVGGIIKQVFRNHKRKYSAAEIKEDMKEKYGLNVSYSMAWGAKEKALEELRGKPAASYQRIPPYIYILNTTYPGSHIRLKKTSDDRFLYIFIALNAFIKGFEHCRPIVVVDGSHLRGVYTGTFVSASTMDAAGHIFPLAYGVIDSKNDAAWTWFFQEFKEAYGEREGLCVVSDRNTSIIKAVSRVYTGVPHFACIFHLWGNVHKNFRKSHELLFGVFYALAKAYTQHDFDSLMAKIESVDMRVKKYLEKAGYDKWSALYSPVNHVWTMTSNLAETINSKLVDARELPIYDFLEEVRKLFARWNYENKKEATYTFTPLAGKFQDILRNNEALSTRMTVVAATEFVYSVRDGDRNFIVCLKNKTCTCMRFQVEQIVCEHAYAVLHSKNFHPDGYCSEYYKPKKMLEIYDVPIYPFPEYEEWMIPNDVQEDVVLPPAYKRPPGRPPKMDRAKTAIERSEKKSTNRCSACGFSGHNRRSCIKRQRCM